jgi:hypothetical protein
VSTAVGQGVGWLGSNGQQQPRILCVHVCAATTCSCSILNGMGCLQHRAGQGGGISDWLCHMPPHDSETRLPPPSPCCPCFLPLLRTCATAPTT